MDQYISDALHLEKQKDRKYKQLVCYQWKPLLIKTSILSDQGFSALFLICENFWADFGHFFINQCLYPDEVVLIWQWVGLVLRKGLKCRHTPFRTFYGTWSYLMATLHHFIHSRQSSSCSCCSCAKTQTLWLVVQVQKQSIICLLPRPRLPVKWFSAKRNFQLHSRLGFREAGISQKGEYSRRASDQGWIDSALLLAWTGSGAFWHWLGQLKLGTQLAPNAARLLSDDNLGRTANCKTPPSHRMPPLGNPG